MSAPILSIVTVTFRDLPGLERTLSSLQAIVSQAGADVEVHVVDGGTVGIEYVVSDSGVPVSFISEPDNGIYDAMNKGLASSTGEFVWFLNGGDLCLERDWGRLKADLHDAGAAGLLFAYEMSADGRLLRRSPRSMKYIWHGLPTSHQAIFYPGVPARKCGYDDSYRIAGDYEFTARVSATFNIQWRRIDRPIARFHNGGASTSHRLQISREASRVQLEVLSLSRLTRILSRVRHTVSRKLADLLLK